MSGTGLKEEFPRKAGFPKKVGVFLFRTGDSRRIEIVALDCVLAFHFAFAWQSVDLVASHRLAYKIP